jgi:hypothetical protein
MKNQRLFAYFQEKSAIYITSLEIYEKYAFERRVPKDHHSLVGITFDQRSNIFKSVFENIGLACIF